MARYNDSISVTFNDNDGRVDRRWNPFTASDIWRHHIIFGKWRSRWIFFKQFWWAMREIEDYAYKYHGDDRTIRKWVFRSEISE